MTAILLLSPDLEETKAIPEANIIKKKDKLLGRFIPYLTCKNKE